jgi:hypothetical protein
MFVRLRKSFARSLTNQPELKNMPAKSKPSPKKKAQGKVRDIKPGKNPKGGLKGSLDAPFIRR